MNTPYTYIKSELSTWMMFVQTISVTTIKKLATLASAESRLPAGFTLIELLVVIAILGILASVVLVAINPAQRIAEANDTKMKSAVSQVATAAEACYTHLATGLYSGGCGSLATLQSNGFLKVSPIPAPSIRLKTTAPANTEIKIYGQLTAKSARPGGCGTNPYVVYSSIDGTTQIVCAAPGAF